MRKPLLSGYASSVDNDDDWLITGLIVVVVEFEDEDEDDDEFSLLPLVIVGDAIYWFSKLLLNEFALFCSLTKGTRFLNLKHHFSNFVFLYTELSVDSQELVYYEIATIKINI